MLFTNAMAQEVCVDLANSIVSLTSSFSSDEQHDINRAELCIEQYKHDASATSLKIETSYKFFSLGVAGSQTTIEAEQSKQCKNKYGDFWRRNIRSASAKIASADSLAVIRECLILSGTGMTPKMKISNDGRAFTFTLVWRPSIPADLRVDYVGPLDFTGYQCIAQSGLQGAFKPVKFSDDVKTVVPNGGSFMLSCNRPVFEKIVDGEKFACYDETLLNVATNGPPAVLTIPERCTPSMPGSRAAAIEQRIAALDDQLKKTRSSMDSLGSPTTANANSCSVIGALQICWGTAVLTPNPSAPHTAGFSFTFPRQFAATPTVTNGININGSGHNAGVYISQITSQTYHGGLNNVFTAAPLIGNITMQYIAIGPAK